MIAWTSPCLFLVMFSSYLSRSKSLFVNPVFLRTKIKLALSPLSLSVFHLSSFRPLLFTPANPKDSRISREQLLHSLLKECSSIINLKQIHAQIIQSGFNQDLFFVGKIITLCAASYKESMDYAVSIFEQTKSPDVFIWNTMIRGIGQTSEPGKAFGLYKRMLENGEAADNFTYSFLLKICVQLRDVELGKQIHCCTLKHGLDSHVFVRNTLIHSYGIFNDIDAARHLFEEIPRADLVGWNTIMDCYVQCGKCEEALELFLRMQHRGVEPDDVTLVVVFSACSELGALHFGKWVHSCNSCTDLEGIVSVSNSLIDMYSKCGEIGKARLIFNKLKKKNIVSWNSMILGLAMHGYADDALELFSDMRELKLETPNDVTFLGVLCACSHRGLVDEGRRCFTLMSSDYGIQPSIKHYGCMVDLLGRAGFVEEAYQLIRGMPIKCNAITWRTLLGACRVHGHLELGTLVRKHLMELEPEHSGDYVLLASMYAHEGRWNDMLRVREAMRVKRVQKPEPGNSLSLMDNNPKAWLESPI